MLGYYEGYKTAQSFNDLCNWFFTKGRRPLVKHDINCECVGVDEHYFAKLLETAAYCDKEDAIMLAILQVPANIAPLLADLACSTGLALKRITLRNTKH